MSPKAINFKSTYWATSQGVAGFAGSRNFGIVNASGTHALWNNASNQPVIYNTMKTTKLVAPHANALATNGHHSWVPVWSSRSAVPSK